MCRMIALGLLATSSVILEVGHAQEPPALPPPPSPALNGESLRFDKSKTAEENALSRDQIERKLQELQGKLNEIDKERLSLLSSSNNQEAATPPPPRDRERIVKEIREWTAVKSRFDAETQCNPVDMTQDVELYNGKLGPAQEFVELHQAATGQIQWNASFDSLGEGGDSGNVADARWCTGTLISDNYFLTAGHCFDPQTNGWMTPSRMKDGKQVPLSPQDLAPLMHVNFNYQLNGQTRQMRPAEVFPIIRLVEHRIGSLDYAIVELGKNADGKPPSSRFFVQGFDSSSAALSSARVLTLIQHPDGRPKVIGAGIQLAVQNQKISYSDIDTLGGSSGSGIISQTGQLIGVHTNGGCTVGGGANFGVTLNAISKFSKIIQ